MEIRNNFAGEISAALREKVRPKKKPAGRPQQEPLGTVSEEEDMEGVEHNN